jgi:hypothetical protein
MVLETHETRRYLNLFPRACRIGKLYIGRYGMLNSSPGVCCMFHQIAEGRRGVGVMTAAKPKAVGGLARMGRLRIACIHKLAGYLSSSAHPVAICRLFRVQLASFVATALLQHSLQLRARLLPTRPRNHTPHQRHRPHLLQAQSQPHTLSRAPGIVTSLYNSTSAEKSTPAGPSGSRRKDRCSAPTTPSLRIVNVD